MYAKIFQSIYDGSIAKDWQLRLVFMDFLVLADREGVVDLTPEAISRRTGVPLDIVLKGIAELESPDPRSRRPDMNGRRIERLDNYRDWGWRIVNYKYYRNLMSLEQKREADRLRLQRKRQEDKLKKPKKSTTVAGCRNLSHHVANVAEGELEGELDKRVPPLIPPKGEKDIFGEFNNVLLTADQFSKLNEKYGKADSWRRIQKLSQYMASKGKTYKNHYATILSWDRRDEQRRQHG